MQSSHGYVMPCSTWLTKRMHRWKLLIIRLRLWEVRTVDSIASSYFQCFGKSVGQYQGLPPHSDEYKTLEKSWLSYACHAMREGLPGFCRRPSKTPYPSWRQANKQLPPNASILALLLWQERNGVSPLASLMP